jgi:hypothetical protein
MYFECHVIQYYEAVGACVSSDSAFEELLIGCWQLTREAVDDATTAIGSTTNSSGNSSSSTYAPVTASVLVTLADGARRIEQVHFTLLTQSIQVRSVQCCSTRKSRRVRYHCKRWQHSYNSVLHGINIVTVLNGMFIYTLTKHKLCCCS